MEILTGTGGDSKRVNELKKYNILDTRPESNYENIARLTSAICDVPIALISFMDENRQWLKSSVGIEVSEVERTHSFCNHAIQNPKEIMVVEDARKDSRFQNNPFVAGAPHLVFYAGIPLTNKQGFALGTICVLDTKPKKLTSQQTMALKLFAIQVMHLLELRRIDYEHEMLQAKMKTADTQPDQTVEAVTNNIKTSLYHLLDDEPQRQNWYDEVNNNKTSPYHQVGRQMETKIKLLIEKLLPHYKIAASVSA